MKLGKDTIIISGLSSDDFAIDEDTVLHRAEEEANDCPCGHGSMLRSMDAIIQYYQRMIRELTMTPEQRRDEDRKRERAALGLPPLTKEDEYHRIVLALQLPEDDAAVLAKKMKLVLDGQK
jgi:hypothetical protein